jgi:hypothetical protein
LLGEKPVVAGHGGAKRKARQLFLDTTGLAAVLFVFLLARIVAMLKR